MKEISLHDFCYDGHEKEIKHVRDVENEKPYKERRWGEMLRLQRDWRSLIGEVVAEFKNKFLEVVLTADQKVYIIYIGNELGYNDECAYDENIIIYDSLFEFAKDFKMDEFALFQGKALWALGTITEKE